MIPQSTHKACNTLMAFLIALLLLIALALLSCTPQEERLLAQDSLQVIEDILEEERESFHKK